MKIEIVTVVVAVTITILSLIFGVTYQSVTKDKIFAETIAGATAKGVDPLAVRCSFAASYDQICLVYAATSKK